MSAYTPQDDTLIEDLEQLVEFMLKRVKSPDEWVIGTEHEKIGYSIPRGKRPQFQGEIEEVLLAIENRGWQATRERGRDEADGQGAIISLHHQGSSVTLEPGGQLELSGAPVRSLFDTNRELRDHLHLLSEVSEPLGLVWAGLGTDPTPPRLTPKMPKARYGVMRKYLPSRGDLALHMMHSTCTIQSNLDYRNELDAMRKLRASLYVQPIVMAMFANSFLLDDHVQQGTCVRSKIWLNTDPDRYFYPARFLDEEARLIDYVKWAIDVPMFFIARSGEYLDCAGLPFSQYMHDGFSGYKANMGDFELHLSTLFPDARLKQHLEVRGADMSSPEYVTALSAFHVGLLYSEAHLDQCLALFEGVSADMLWEARAQVDEQGLETLLNGQSFQSWALKLLSISKEGLSVWEPGSEQFLDPLIERIERGETPAQYNRSLWLKGYQALIEGTQLA